MKTVAVFGAPCHSERSEESSEITLRVSALSKWILHFVQNDKPRAISATVFLKPCLFVLALLFASLCTADRGFAQAQAPTPATGSTYQQFFEQMVTPENLTDCISKMDALIDEEERLAVVSQGVPQTLETETKLGLHFSFRIIISNDGVVYYLVVSRNGQELSFDDGAKLTALFCDRAGLPHPVAITEGEKPVFYAEWLIKHSDWKAMKKMMAKVRAENRSEKNPQKAFVIAINREIAAREAAPPSDP
jgi:hypothetical protein